MERTNIMIILECQDKDQDKLSFTIKRSDAIKSKILEELISRNEPNCKDVRHIRLKVNSPLEVFFPIKHYLLSGSNSIDLIPEWLSVLDSKYVIDALVLATHLKITGLCRVLYSFLENESDILGEFAFSNKFGISLDESVLSSSEIEKLNRLCTI
jgi:hypothetical protein